MTADVVCLTMPLMSCSLGFKRPWEMGPYDPLTVKLTSRVSVLLASLSVTLISSR
jgi:hypothetical protein